MSTMYFQYDGQYYQQVHGTPMGSPISVAISDMFVEHLEDLAMDTALPDMRPNIWDRYIDDSFKVVHRNKQDELTEHLNTIDKSASIKFTDEPEKDDSIPFLDAHICWKDDGVVKVQVYRKVTHTDQVFTPTTDSTTGWESSRPSMINVTTSPWRRVMQQQRSSMWIRLWVGVGTPSGHSRE